jgi:tetratricopeptide (TPR) repeat protein
MMAFTFTQPAHGQIMEEKYDKATQLHKEGVTHDLEGTAESMRAALEKFEQARLIYQEINAQPEETYCLGRLGSINNSLGNKQKALDYFEQALPLLRAVGDIRFEALTISCNDLTYSNSDIENFSDLSEKNH